MEWFGLVLLVSWFPMGWVAGRAFIKEGINEGGVETHHVVFAILSLVTGWLGLVIAGCCVPKSFFPKAMQNPGLEWAKKVWMVKE
jgi:hypothetical protein